MERNHTDINGKSTAIKDLTTPHLKNIIAMLKRAAKRGVELESGAFGWDSCEMDYNCDVVYGRDALDAMNYQAYVDELTSREESERYRSRR